MPHNDDDDDYFEEFTDGSQICVRLLSTTETARFIGMSAHWVKAARFRPELNGPKFIRLSPGSIKYDPRDLDEWLSERRFRGTYEYTSSKKGGKS